MASLDRQRITGSGSYLYAVARESIWYSHDRGATWQRTERPIGTADGRLVVSRDDPRVAYGDTIRTLDGGATWQAITPSGAGLVNWIAPGDPLHIFAIDNFVSESVDGGQTWSESPQAHWCVLEPGADTTSPTGSRLRCNGFWTASDPLRALPSPVLYVPGLVAAPDLPGTYAVALPRGIAGSSRAPLLGELTSDWSWASLLAQTGSIGPSATADAVTAWPAAGGTTFYAWDEATSTSWVRRGAGRWWRLRVAGRDTMVFAALDATHALVGTPAQYGERGVVDLTQPSLAPPLVQPAAGGLACVVPWSAADAETTGYAWLRDGAPIAGATGATYSPVATRCRSRARLPRDGAHRLRLLDRHLGAPAGPGGAEPTRPPAVSRATCARQVTRCRCASRPDEHERGVVAAEAEAVRERRAHVDAVPRRAHHVIEAAAVVGLHQVERGRHDAAHERQQRRRRPRRRPRRRACGRAATWWPRRRRAPGRRA